jgi:N-acylneuraminate cytidylyltransferase
MWIINGSRMNPVWPGSNGSTPWHSSQYASLPEIYVQNASLEIAYTKILKQCRTISGEFVMPFISNGIEGFDINTEEDWVLAEYYAQQNPDILPRVNVEPWRK